MPTIPEALATAVQHQQAGRLQAAEQIYRQILAMEPAHADTWHLLGLLAHQVGKQEIAIEYIGYAIRLNPGVAAFHSNLGVAYRALDKLEEATACWQRALELNPDYADALNNLGNVLRERGQPDQAVICYRRALALNPDNPAAYYNFGTALSDQGLLTDAVACYRRALAMKPDYPDALNNLGFALKRQGKLDEAATCYRRALELRPDFAACRLNQAVLWLLRGDFAHGWPEYESRWPAGKVAARDFRQPLWDGRPLEGRTILLHAEQGFGDTIQFIRYAPLVEQRGARVIVECPKPLVRLLAAWPRLKQVVLQGEPLPPFDVHSPLLSLPGIFHTSLENIPGHTPYLFAASDLIEHWRGKLSASRGFKIGIVWHGDPRQENNRARSIPLSCFESLAGLPGVQLVSLQKGSGVEQLQDAAARFGVREAGSRLDDFMDTAAVIMNLDLVIACDTAVAHLAGALGVSVWVALCCIPDWRWLLDRDDCPWYPTMRLFRQEKPGNWADVFAEIKTALTDGQASGARGRGSGVGGRGTRGGSGDCT
jgi:tetratricopeptide (TPR) repeat protein